MKIQTIYSKKCSQNVHFNPKYLIIKFDKFIFKSNDQHHCERFFKHQRHRSGAFRDDFCQQGPHNSSSAGGLHHHLHPCCQHSDHLQYQSRNGGHFPKHIDAPGLWQCADAYSSATAIFQVLLILV